jgi:hypothetical protein
MALNARLAWETHFSEQAMLGELGRQLRSLLAWDGEDRIATRLSGRVRISLGLMSWKSRQGYALVQNLRARGRKFFRRK